MILDVPTRKLQIVLTAGTTANKMTVLAEWLDKSSLSESKGLTASLSNGTTAVDILPAPASLTTRELRTLSVYNKDTAVKTVKILFNDGGTTYEVVKTTLQVDDTLGYSMDDGWYVQDLNGARKTVPSLSDVQLATLIHAAVSKTTPVGADELPMWDSVTGLLNRLTFTNALNWFAATLGNASNVFSVAAATAAAHAVRADQVSADFTNYPLRTSGSFTGTMTGCTTSPTGTINYTMIGDVVTITMHAQISGTSNTTAKTITGMPAGIRPTANIFLDSATSNNGAVYAAGEVLIDSSGVMNFYTSLNGGAWTASGVATIQGFSFTYVR